MPPSTKQDSASSSAGVDADITARLDELHTVAALLAGALAVAEAGSQVERCLMVASQALGSSIAGLTELA
jgi:hypothetical protein